MSTKTTFKRVALVVAAAVSFGGISAVSAHAVDDNAVLRFVSGDGNGASPYNTGNGVAGAFNYVTVEVRGTPASDYVVTTDSTFGTVSPSGAVVSSDRKSFSDAGNTGNVQVMTPAVGTVTVSYWVRTAGVLASTAAETIKVTVNAAAAHGVFSAAKSTVYGYTGDTTTAASITATTDAAFSVTSDSGDASTKIASFAITQNDANGDVMTDGAAKAVTVYTTGGKLHDGSSYVGSYASVAAGTAAVKVFQISPNGVVGTATVTVGINGVTAKTFSITFTSSVAKTLTLTAANTNIATSATASLVTTPLGTTSAAPTYVLVAKDVNGNAIKSSSLSGVTPASSDTTVAATPTIGTYSSTLGGYPVYTTGAAAGTATLSVTSSADSTIKASGAVNVVDAKIASLALALDNTSYAPGDLVTASLTAANAAGKSVADGTYTDVLAGALASNQSLPNGASAFAANVKFVNGVGTATFYAPGSSFTVKGTIGEGAAVAAAIQDGSLPASATVVNAAVDAANAAADAAAEATDAANAATDAATNAMDSADAAQQAAMDAGDKADAALAAITDLASKVQSFITTISAQISALSAAVAKIKSKVKA